LIAIKAISFNIAELLAWTLIAGATIDTLLAMAGRAIIRRKWPRE
jgi:hypothetical protein